MSKRKPTAPLKRPNVLDPFIDTDKLEIYNTRPDAAKSRNQYQGRNAKIILDKMQKSYNDLDEYSDELQDKELADFLFSAVTRKLDEIPNDEKYGTLDKLYLLDTPYINSKTKGREDLYDSKFAKKENKGRKSRHTGIIEQAITLSPNKNSTNPIIALIHEVTHALDDNYMRIPQREIIDYLAELEDKSKIETSGTEIENLIKNAQAILPESTNFVKSYRAREHFISSIQDAMQNVGDKDTEDGVLANEGLANSKNSYAIKNFAQLKKALDLLREAKIGDNGGDPGQALWEFSEFPAFAMETLNIPWLVDHQTDPLAKGFMYRVIEGLNRGVERFNVDKYPLVKQGLQDKKMQLEFDKITRPLPQFLLTEDENKDEYNP